ncbi:MAG TPA: PAS domain-containing sensor histidine kinase [Bacteroidia bacterium]|nr:PAS domain-containing sensor histidine kinase [Bacteroidia bacterium]HQF28043.1 PAS domain-containing sensor histidine kinase [Bacteroidia bacterium]HQK96922.1 PAS domain-containing sensor histidine kinase [Bacteroidia bacterium]
MNCIINQHGTIIGLKENVLKYLPPDCNNSENLCIHDFITGLPNIFPLNINDHKLEFKNLQLIKNVGLFSTHQNEDYLNLKLQKYETKDQELNFLCSFEFTETENLSNSNKINNLDLISDKISKDEFIKLIEGSVFTINDDGIVTSVIQDGELGILNRYNIQVGINILTAVDNSNSEIIKNDLAAIRQSQKSKSIQYRFRDRHKELIIEGKINFIDTGEYLLYIKDVTVLKKLEKEKEEFAKFSLDNPNPVFRLNIAGKVLFANSPAIDFTRKIGKTNNIIHNKDIKAIVKASIFDGVTRSIKIKINKEFFFLTIAPNKENKYVNVYALNITQQEIFHEKLKQKSVDLNSILNSSEDSILLINKSFDLIYYNQKAADLLGQFEIKQINAWTQIFQYIPKEYQNNFIYNSTKCLTNSEVIKIDFEIKEGKNSGRIFSITYFPAIDKVQNKIIGICIQFREITESTRIKLEIIKQKDFYEAILNNLPNDIAVLDSNRKYLFINPTAISDEELRKFMIGKDDYDYAEYRKIDSKFADRRKVIFDEIATNGISSTFEDIHRKKDGKEIVILRKYFPVLKDNKLEMMLGYGLDITSIRESEKASKRSEEEVRIANNKLQRNYTQLMQYSYIVSHNLRAPIANLIGLSKCFKEDTDAYNKTIINHIQESSQRIDEILRDLNSILSIREEVNGSSVTIDLETVFNEAANDLKEEIAESKAEIITDFSELKSIHSIHSFIHSIFYNLISNSVKYRSDKRDCKIHIRSHRKENNLIITFTDNGIGIDLEKHGHKVFGLYKRFHKNVATGTGIGLHLIKEQIETLGGTISVASTPEIGTSFTITLNDEIYEQNTTD